MTAAYEHIPSMLRTGSNAVLMVGDGARPVRPVRSDLQSFDFSLGPQPVVFAGL